MRNLLAMSTGLLVVVVGVGCGGDEASSRQELPGGPQPVATFVDDGALLPGNQTAPDPAAVTTTAPRSPIGRPLNPVPANRTPVTRPPSNLDFVTTPSTSTTTTTTAPVTPG